MAADLKKESLDLHRRYKGKTGLLVKVPLRSRYDLSLCYTPGVAAVSEAIRDNPAESFNLTSRGNTIAVISDGSAVLGLGNTGPEAAIPVMEGKCLLFKKLAGLDAVPLCLDTQDTSEIIRTVTALAPSFAGINLEDISAPRCFEIEKQLRKKLLIPVIHDDQHATAIVTAAALINSLRVTGKKINELRAVVCGTGAAGNAVIRIIHQLGVKNISAYDRFGEVYQGRTENDSELEDLSKLLAPCGKKTPGKALFKADIFIGLSAGNIISRAEVSEMNHNSIVFAMANPVPEIFPEEASAAGAAVIATGRSDYPNQINNVLAFPGLFSGMIRKKRLELTMEIKLRAAEAIASLVSKKELRKKVVIPGVFNRNLVEKIIEAV